MAEYNIYQDISERSGGDVYIGVVGPVRTGKSTFIKKFMDLLVIPNISSAYTAERTRDELPQSAAGRTIMTTEPKFVPNEAVRISVGDNACLNVRMIDCVGYIADGSLGYLEDDEPRMVRTPWSDEPMPFFEAAETGTKKVIREHSNIGIVVTTDGSITELEREAYIDAESRVISELKEINKPFIILLNSVSPDGVNARNLKTELEKKYNAPVVAVSCEDLTAADINKIIEAVLFEFPIREIRLRLPSWVYALPPEHRLKSELYAAALEHSEAMRRIRDIKPFSAELSTLDCLNAAAIDGMDLGSGSAVIDLRPADGLFFKILSEETGFEIDGEGGLISLMRELAQTKAEYEKIASALRDVRETGYGIVSPGTDELTLDEPKIVKQGGKFGVKLKASAPSIHMMRATIETEHLIYKMKMGIKSEKKYQDFEIEYRIAV